MSVVVCVSATLARITQGPQNTVVVDGSQVSLSCLTDSEADELCWNRNYGRGPGLVCSAVVGCREPERFSTALSTHNNRWRHSLMIESCNSSDSGHYICEGCLESDDKKSAHLVVFGKSVLAIFLYDCHILLK